MATAGPWAWKRFVLFLLWCSDAAIWLLFSVPPVCLMFISRWGNKPSLLLDISCVFSLRHRLFSPLQPFFFAAAAVSSTCSVMYLPAVHPRCSFCLSTADRMCGQNLRLTLQTRHMQYPPSTASSLCSHAFISYYSVLWSHSWRAQWFDS